MLKWTTAASLALSLCGAAMAEERGRTINLTPGFSEVVALARPASTVVIGDPDIADVTVGPHDKLVITPKNIGATNLIAFDQDGKEILRAILDVGADDVINVRFPIADEKNPAASVRRAYRCRPACNPLPELAGGQPTQGRTAVPPTPPNQ